ncbi:MAG TPA: T9SS type A sorting domain-containing protein [Saprospiraceae bacterium]|nr:T9SS type A sorting domain-containing protein [Saprospiraceae bacterium]
MKHFLLFFSLLFVSHIMYSQTCCTPQQACEFRSISVGSGNATSLTLSHVGPASIMPTAGQQCNWILGTTTNPGLSNVTTTATNGLFTFNLTALGISTSDVIVATCIITNTTGDVCSIIDQNIVWTLVNPTLQIFQWRTTTPAVNGIFDQAPLPVDWISFNGKSLKGNTHLDWSTASEMNNEGYMIQVSTEKSPWETIGFVKGKGNTSAISYYNFVHRNVPQELLYYKLIQVDYDGRTNESKIISIDNANQALVFNDFEIYPNPSNGQITIDLGSTPFDSFELNIYNSIGQTIRTLKQKDINNPIISLMLPEQGLYFIHINMDGNEQTKRFIIE